jgi:hypothetical protein
MKKKEAISLAEQKKQKVIIYSVSAVLVLVIGFAFFVYRSFLEKKRANIEIGQQKTIIEQKQKEIIDSIQYAKRIQVALLTPERYIERNLKRLYGQKS